MKPRIYFVAIGLLLIGCVGSGGGFGAIKKTNQLEPGMQPAQVKAILGEPSQSQFVADKWVWKYSLHEPWKGFIPYYLIFNKEDPSLQEWFANEAEYFRQQELWLEAMPPTQKHEVDVTIKER